MRRPLLLLLAGLPPAFGTHVGRAGCVSAPRWFLARATGALDDGRVPVIAIGR